MQVCFGCQHTFPSTALDSVNVSADLAHRLERLRALVARVQPANSAGREAVAEIEESLKSILGVLRHDLEDKQAKIRKLEHQIAYVNKENEDLRSAQLDAAMANQTAQRTNKTARNISLIPLGPTHMLERFLSTNNMNRGAPHAPVPPRGNAPPGRSSTSARTGTAPLVSAAKPSDLVSSAIFCCIEALVVTTRSEVGVLWLRPQDSAGELLAPFIAGQTASSIRSSAPYRISSSSLVGTVAATGIAVNLSPRTKSSAIAAVPAAEAQDMQHHSGGEGKRGKQSFSQFLEDNHNANLLVPVFSRYGEHARQTIGVVQLIGSTTNPFPFNERNEQHASQASALLSHIITSFMPTMLVEWSTRIYDHSVLSASASYSALLDQRAKEKGVDDFDPTPTLIYRSQNTERTVPKNLAQTKVFKGEVQQGAARLDGSPSDALKELHRYLRSLEDNWGQSVNLQTVLEKKVEQLSAQLDAARHGLHTLSKSGAIVEGGDAPNRKLAFIAQNILQQHRANRAAVSTVDVEDIENDVMQRLQTSATAVFLTPEGALSTPMKRRADAAK
jgi:hypothetical protein